MKSKSHSCARNAAIGGVVSWVLLTTSVAQPTGYNESPRTPGVVSEFVQVADQPALEVSISPSGILVLTAGNNLDFYFGEDFSQRLPILQDGAFFALSKKGFERNGEIIYSFIGDNDVKVLRINPGQGPQGATFSIEDVSTEDHFWSSDLFVTATGEVLVLAYFIAQEGGLFTPRFFRGSASGASPQGAGLSFQEVSLGLSGVFLGAINGSPRMVLVPYLFEGNIVYFWAVRQFSAQLSDLLVVAIDLDEVGPQGAETRPGQAAVNFWIVDQVVSPAVLEFNPLVEAVGFALAGLSPVYLHLDVNDFISFKVFNPATRQSQTTNVGCTNIPGSEVRQINSTGTGPNTPLANVGSNQFRLPGFGTFQVRRRASRQGRNPHTGEAIELEAADVWSSLKTQFSNEVAVKGQSAQGGGQPVLGFRRIFVGEAEIVPQIVKGEGLTKIVVSNPEDFAQSVDWVLTNQDGSVFQSGSEDLAGGQTIQIDVEGDPAGLPGSAYFASPFGLTIQSLVDLSSIVETPGFGAPGVAADTGWTFPYENPQALAAAADTTLAGAQVTRETGVAIHNVENLENTCAFTARDPAGSVVGEQVEEFSPGEQKALFVSQLFDNLASASGLMEVDCSLPVAVVGAQQESTGAIVLTPARPD